MNILEIVLDILTAWGPPRADNDNSIVGQSPIEQGVSRFWQRIGFILLLAAAAAALYVWVISPRLSHSASQPTSSTQPALTQ